MTFARRTDLVLAGLVLVLVGAGFALGVYMTRGDPVPAIDPVLVARAESLDAVRASLAVESARLAHLRDSVARIAAADAAERRRTRAVVGSLESRLAAYDTLPSVPRDTAAAWVAACLVDARAADAALASCAAETHATAAERDTALAHVAVAEARIATADTLRTQAEARTEAAERATRRERLAKWGALLLAGLAAIFR